MGIYHISHVNLRENKKLMAAVCLISVPVIIIIKVIFHWVILLFVSSKDNCSKKQNCTSCYIFVERLNYFKDFTMDQSGFVFLSIIVSVCCTAFLIMFLTSLMILIYCQVIHKINIINQFINNNFPKREILALCNSKVMKPKILLESSSSEKEDSDYDFKHTQFKKKTYKKRFRNKVNNNNAIYNNCTFYSDSHEALQRNSVFKQSSYNSFSSKPNNPNVQCYKQSPLPAIVEDINNKMTSKKRKWSRSIVSPSGSAKSSMNFNDNKLYIDSHNNSSVESYHKKISDGFVSPNNINSQNLKSSNRQNVNSQNSYFDFEISLDKFSSEHCSSHSVKSNIIQTEVVQNLSQDIGQNCKDEQVCSHMCQSTGNTCHTEIIVNVESEKNTLKKSSSEIYSEYDKKEYAKQKSVSDSDYCTNSFDAKANSESFKNNTETIINGSIHASSNSSLGGIGSTGSLIPDSIESSVFPSWGVNVVLSCSEYDVVDSSKHFKKSNIHSDRTDYLPSDVRNNYLKVHASQALSDQRNKGYTMKHFENSASIIELQDEKKYNLSNSSQQVSEQVTTTNLFSYNHRDITDLSKGQTFSDNVISDRNNKNKDTTGIKGTRVIRLCENDLEEDGESQTLSCFNKSVSCNGSQPSNHSNQKHFYDSRKDLLTKGSDVNYLSLDLRVHNNNLESYVHEKDFDRLESVPTPEISTESLKRSGSQLMLNNDSCCISSGFISNNPDSLNMHDESERHCFSSVHSICKRNGDESLKFYVDNDYDLTLPKMTVPTSLGKIEQEPLSILSESVITNSSTKNQHSFVQSRHHSLHECNITNNSSIQTNWHNSGHQPSGSVIVYQHCGSSTKLKRKTDYSLYDTNVDKNVDNSHAYAKPLHKYDERENNKYLPTVDQVHDSLCDKVVSNQNSMDLCYSQESKDADFSDTELKCIRPHSYNRFSTYNSVNQFPSEEFSPLCCQQSDNVHSNKKEVNTSYDQVSDHVNTSHNQELTQRLHAFAQESQHLRSNSLSMLTDQYKSVHKYHSHKSDHQPSATASDVLNCSSVNINTPYNYKNHCGLINSPFNNVLFRQDIDLSLSKNQSEIVHEENHNCDDSLTHYAHMHGEMSHNQKFIDQLNHQSQNRHNSSEESQELDNDLLSQTYKNCHISSISHNQEKQENLISISNHQEGLLRSLIRSDSHTSQNSDEIENLPVESCLAAGGGDNLKDASQGYKKEMKHVLGIDLREVDFMPTNAETATSALANIAAVNDVPYNWHNQPSIEFEEPDNFSGFATPSRNRIIYEQLKGIEWVMGYFSTGGVIDVFVDLQGLDHAWILQELCDVTGEPASKFVIKDSSQEWSLWG